MKGGKNTRLLRFDKMNEFDCESIYMESLTCNYTNERFQDKHIEKHSSFLSYHIIVVVVKSYREIAKYLI